MPETPWHARLNWSRFFSQAQRDTKLWLFFMVWFLLFRAVFIGIYRQDMAPTSGLGDVMLVLLNGMRYDATIASYIVVPSLLLTLGCLLRPWERAAGRLRLIWGIIAFAVAAMTCGGDIGFYGEFRDQFNEMFFGLFTDDTVATLKTMWNSYNPIVTLTPFVVAIILGGWCLRWWLGRDLIPVARTEQWFAGRRARIAVTLVLAVCFVGGIRGSFGRRPVQRKDAAVTRDNFLNICVPNPFTALRYAYKTRARLAHAEGLATYIPHRDIRRAAQEFAATETPPESLDTVFTRVAPGPQGTPPRHVVLLLMETYEGWALEPRFASLGLTNSLRDLADRGVEVPAFAPGANGTMQTMNILMTGLADAGVDTNYRPNSKQAYPTSIAAIFHRLGYRTRLFYGGYLSWQKLQTYAGQQGFDEVYGAAHMGEWSHTNEWGVDDEYLFDFAAKTVTDHEPSFTLILSTSFHPPFDIDVRAKGFPLQSVPPELADICPPELDYTMLGHLWYADRCIGEFVADIEPKLPDLLVAVTGDHSGRRMITTHPTLLEQSTVPCVFYGPAVLEGISAPEGAAGSHIDLVRTLVEATAPAGFEYQALGQNLLRPNDSFMGLGRFSQIGPDWVSSTRQQPPRLEATVPGATLPDVDTILARHGRLHALSWWRIMRGPDLTQSTP